MTVGAILPPSRPRFQANERFDDVDAQALSDAELLFLDAYSRAITTTPEATGGSSPVGMILQGFGLTLNPTSSSDNRVRVQSPAGVCFDSNGRMIIKQAGVTTDLVLGAGSNQIYAYYIEDQTDVATRRFISVTSPYTESSGAMATTLTADVGYFTQSGNQTSIIASAVVNGATVALCFLGVANNTAGTITMPGYNSVTAPNGMYATNRLVAAAAPSLPPTTNAMNGSLATITDMLQTLAYFIGQLAWAGSAKLTPAPANNYGWTTAPVYSVQALAEAVYGVKSNLDQLRGGSGSNLIYGGPQLQAGITFPGYQSSGANPIGIIDLAGVPYNAQFASLQVWSGQGPAGTWTLSYTHYLASTGGFGPSFTVTVPASGTAVSTTFNLLAASIVQSFTAAAGGVYTRTTGSFVTDGFFIGQPVNTTGFVNGANNVTNATITAVSALSMTVSVTGQIAETSATAQVVATPLINNPGDTWECSIGSTGITGANAQLSRVAIGFVPIG